MRSALKWIALSALTGGFVAAACWSVRLAWADYQFRLETIPGTERAIAATPNQAAYYTRLALLDSEEGAGRRASEALERAVALNPHDAQSWIELGLRDEVDGRYRAAEECLLRAASEDKQYLPRWTLANYYLRRSDTARFQTWAKEAAAMVYGDPAPLFRLCDRISEGGDLIDQLGVTRPEVRAGYLWYVLGENRPELIARASRHVLESRRESDVPPLMAACERLAGSKRVDEALEIWNQLAGARAIPFEPLAPAKGAIVTNGGFGVAPTSQGFDWRLPETQGVSTSVEDQGGLRMAFSGAQSERCEPLAQTVPVEAGTGYRLVCRYRTWGIEPGAGLRWRISEMDGTVLQEGESLSSKSETESETRFRTPAGCRAVRLSLRYDRAPGTTRIEGYVVLRNVAASRAP